MNKKLLRRYNRHVVIASNDIRYLLATLGTTVNDHPALT